LGHTAKSKDLRPKAFPHSAFIPGAADVRITREQCKGDFMRRDELVEAIHARPFQPFRLCVSDGRTFDIRHPEMLMVARHSASVGLPENGGEELPGQAYPRMARFAMVDLLHITGIEHLSQSQSDRRGG
jgi:hypothetical protein